MGLSRRTAIFSIAVQMHLAYRKIYYSNQCTLCNCLCPKCVQMIVVDGRKEQKAKKNSVRTSRRLWKIKRTQKNAFNLNCTCSFWCCLSFCSDFRSHSLTQRRVCLQKLSHMTFYTYKTAHNVNAAAAAFNTHKKIHFFLWILCSPCCVFFLHSSTSSKHGHSHMNCS